MVRSLLRPLGLLRSSAEEVAHNQLPGVVERLHRAEPVDLNAETRPIGIRDRDEIGQVARAFDAVHSTAVRVAAEQAALRRSVADMFLSLGRRLQALVHRQLELLDELERTEADPQQLRSLFQPRPPGHPHAPQRREPAGPVRAPSRCGAGATRCPCPG